MPLPTDMSACIHKVKKEFPRGRGKKKMSKKQIRKQRIAMCLDARRRANESVTHLSFKEFLLETS